MRIILMRHGRPDLDESTPMESSRFADWLDAYREAPLCDEAPPHTASEVARQAACIVCSDLRRSIDSAHRLCPEVDPVIDPRLREMAMPHGPIPLLKLSARRWATLFRNAWLLGYSAGAMENRRQGMARALQAAANLAQLSGEQGKLLFVGHGIFNRFLARELRRAGWQGPADPGRRHWDWAEYRYSLPDSISSRP